MNKRPQSLSLGRRYGSIFLATFIAFGLFASVFLSMPVALAQDSSPEKPVANSIESGANFDVATSETLEVGAAEAKQLLDPAWTMERPPESDNTDDISANGLAGTVEPLPMISFRSRQEVNARSDTERSGSGTWHYDFRRDRWVLRVFPVQSFFPGGNISALVVKTPVANPEFPNIDRPIRIRIGDKVLEGRAERLADESGKHRIKIVPQGTISSDSVNSGNQMAIDFYAKVSGSGQSAKNAAAAAIMRNVEYVLQAKDTDLNWQSPEDPEIPSGSTARLRVKVGGKRSNGDFYPLEGAKLQLHRNDNPDYTHDSYWDGRLNPGNYHWGKPGTTIDEPWALCISDGQGWCDFTVPAPPKTKERSKGIFYWVSPVEGPAGWSPIDTLRIGFSGGTKHENVLLSWGPSYLLDYSYRSPEMFEGMVISSGYDKPGLFYNDLVNPKGFMNHRPGSYSSLTGDEGIEYPRASSGSLLFRKDNPKLGEQCGLKLHLVVDESGSVKHSGIQEDYRSNLSEFVANLEGTGTEVGLSKFGSRANSLLDPVLMDSAGIGTVQDELKSHDILQGGATNWDAALQTTADYNARHPEAPYDAVIVVTDGNPTTSRAGGEGNSTDFAVAEQAIATANLVKSQGTRIFMIGVGAFHVYGGADSTANFIAMTGPKGARQLPPDNESAVTMDWFTLDQVSDLSKSLSEIALSGCKANITVQKKLDDNGTVKPGGAGWVFQGSNLSTGLSWPKSFNPTQQTGDDSIARFKVDLATLQTKGSVQIQEVMTAEQQTQGWKLVKQPYSLQGGEGNQIAVCEDRTTDTPKPYTIKQVGDTGFEIPNLGYGSNIHCVVMNAKVQAPMGNIKILKRGADNSPLSGAEFNLIPGDANGPNQDPSTAVALTPDKHGITWTSDDVEDGIYYIVETKAPEQYELLAVPIGVQITHTADGSMDARLVHPADSGVATLTLDGDTVMVEVADQLVGGQLPLTGGKGVYWYLISGVVVVLAGIMLARKTLS